MLAAGILQPEGGSGADVGPSRFGGSAWHGVQPAADDGGAGPSAAGAAADPTTLANDYAILDG